MTRGCTLVLGGARSGKSGFAQRLAEAGGGPLVYVATAQAFDAEMADRIARHRADRGPRWTTVDAPHDLPDAIAGLRGGGVMLADCLTLWLSNRMLADADMEMEIAALAAAIGQADGHVILVSNEVGSGIVPETPMGRLFRDHAGRANQAVAAVADRVALVIAGLPLWLKGG
ncbi:bifunctional adenosylcobinamide kinase/adenosylcobinamide-phosphate guanylyltransferase [Sphingomonas sp. KC8]|uniref:bifunctional adenosylcobinamide kinase/adenosylcobinamide-phosphate guanylyltransferase n=1 Tax=Sphingomonas sp. KC8 TaxID=1030157 RepID=UPI00049730A1|nr:bifunctional adenosylcobinamide kinase/adenosylcobinamide-phosphate guanylyltransferase [Sphingomonas sp. KC8]ARS28400.1 adenosylcobinamide-phosphate guanylyltransferase [Sphingomonas sp. KC8]